MAKHWTQKLKEENRLLKEHLRTLVEDYNSQASLTIRMHVQFEAEQEKFLWYGDVNDMKN